MKRSTFAAVVAASMLWVAPWAFGAVSLEDSIETSAASVLLPSSELGSILVRACAGCDLKPRSLTLTRETSFEAGGQKISFERMKQLFAASTKHNLLITVAPGTTTVRRVVITSPVSLR